MLLDSNITAYQSTPCTPETSRSEVEKFLAKLDIKTFMWNRDTPEKSYLLFKYKSKYMPEPVAYKVGVPFIEKRGPHNHKEIFYDEKRSFRFFWHIFKHTMLMGEIGMEIEQIFRDFLVIGTNEDGTPMNFAEKHDNLMMLGNISGMKQLL